MANATQPTKRSVSDTTEKLNGVLYQIEIHPADGYPDRNAERVLSGMREAGVGASASAKTAHGFLVQGRLSIEQASKLAAQVLSDSVVQQATVELCGSDRFAVANSTISRTLYVLPKPGVTDPEAETALRAVQQLGFPVDAVRTFRKYVFTGLSANEFQFAKEKFLTNQSIEQAVDGRLQLRELQVGQPYKFELIEVPLRKLAGQDLDRLSKSRTLSLTRVEMEQIQSHFVALGREPTDIELDTIAQTWSEHCSHKTLAGRIQYRDENGEQNFDNMLKETIFAATTAIRAKLGAKDWCVSVFKDNAGIIRFDDHFNVTFKVETHNRPSAIEPYGGANTGLGGVIRDTLGTGMGAKPICSTDVFCFAPPETKDAELPPGVMHPRRIMQGVVAGVRDYGNRMGIPTVNGAIFFEPRYIGNPMVFCGNIGLIPAEHSFKKPMPNDLIVAIGGRTGRDGIHGATFSSVELTEASEKTSSGAVQIGNAITEKMLADVLLQARDRNLFNAVTDCGAGGFSSAVGEMGEEIGAEVWLDKAPLKYEGLTYSEIWISEAQERMVFAVPPENWKAFCDLCSSESVEATVIGQFKPGGQLCLKYREQIVGSLAMHFLHSGRPPIVRQAVYTPVSCPGIESKELDRLDPDQTLRDILSTPSVASKEWIIRQYDHEVQAGSVIKPLVGAMNDGPSDAAVVRPVIRSEQAIAISCGMNPLLGDLDPYHMAASSIDEALRNCVAVGGDPTRTGILDNFCWGYTDRPETLGTLVRAALACRDYAVAFETPFISGKDSLNNEFSYSDPTGGRKTSSIPCTLLISALAHVPNANKCVTMDLKRAGNLLYQVGLTGDHLGGSHAMLISGDHRRGNVPTVDGPRAKSIFESVHRAISKGLVRSCHDLSEGGLAVALAEMAFAGGLGVESDLESIPRELSSDKLHRISALFSESNSRFVCEVTEENRAAFESEFSVGMIGVIGRVSEIARLKLSDRQGVVIDTDINELKKVWQQPLNWS